VGTEDIEVRHSAKILGRLIGANGYRHARQIDWAKKKAHGAMKILGYMGAFSSGADPELAHLLYVYLVQSVMVTAVLNTHLTKTDYKNLRATESKILRKVTWAGQRVAQRAIIRENGKDPIDAAIWKAKSGLFERIKC
jgi:hypothetical protein